MHVAVIGRTYTVRVNRDKWHYVPEGITLYVITPPYVRHTLQTYTAQPSTHWPHTIVPGYFTHRMTGFCFSPRGLFSALRFAHPDLVQVDEEPSSLALLQVLLFKFAFGYRTIFFTWENLAFPRSVLAKLNRLIAFRWADGAIAGSMQAAHLLRQSGFKKHIAVIPQLGVNEGLFRPLRNAALREALGLSAFTVGYVGRLVTEKGVHFLLEALIKLQFPWHWLIVGRGPIEEEIRNTAQRHGVNDRIRWIGTVEHDKVAHYLNAMDVLVLPSVSTPRWKEQFGHVLIEAMACGIPVIGSSSGAIPEVIEDAGLIFPEGDVEALRERLSMLHENDKLRTNLGQRGRVRVLKKYTNRSIAAQTAGFWLRVCKCE
ncbi:MAG: glycosyltransferase [Anaerolineae bacterium]